MRVEIFIRRSGRRPYYVETERKVNEKYEW